MIGAEMLYRIKIEAPDTAIVAIIKATYSYLIGNLLVICEISFIEHSLGINTNNFSGVRILKEIDDL